MLPNCLEQEFVRDVVEQTFDIELQNPVILPATLARNAYRIQSRFSRSVP